MSDDDAIRQMINAIDVEMPNGGDEPSALETIGKEKTVTKRRASRKLFVQKIVTEVYIGTDTDAKAVTEVVDQQLYILGNMSESKFKRLIEAERAIREEEAG